MEVDAMTKLHWASRMENVQGNAYGYYTHNTELKKEAEKILNIGEDADNVLVITSPEFFKDRPEGKKVFLFTMFEGTNIPDQYLEPMKQADHLIAPSNWVADLFKEYFDPDMVSVINHGVSSDFTFKKRKMPLDKPFRFLWLGAHNPRKGWEEVIHVWNELKFFFNPNIELYIKTTTTGKFQRKGNIIFDSRNLPKDQLVKLYHDSHCFLFPSRGEGFGLTLAEAMRTGLPCIATDYSGQKDFFDSSVGYPIKYVMGPGKMKFVGTGEEADTQIAFPELIDLAKNMHYVYHNYEEALKKGKKASQRIKKFTWKRSAFKLKKIVEEFGHAN
jgi:hypothetical protein